MVNDIHPVFLGLGLFAGDRGGVERVRMLACRALAMTWTTPMNDRMGPLRTSY